MPLRKVPLSAAKATVQPSASTVVLPPSPYIQGGTGRFAFRHAELKALLSWMCKRFKGNTAYGEFELAKAMDVHRLIAIEWLCGLCANKMVVSDFIKKPVLDLQCLTFVIPGSVHKEHRNPVEIDFSEIQHLDPWTDRSLDGIVWDWHRPQDYIDKYYSALHHEYYLVKGQQRVRPNKTMFVPTHILFTSWQGKGKQAPPIEVREELDRAVSGSKTMQRPTP